MLTASKTTATTYLYATRCNTIICVTAVENDAHYNKSAFNSASRENYQSQSLSQQESSVCSSSLQHITQSTESSQMQLTSNTMQ